MKKSLIILSGILILCMTGCRFFKKDKPKEEETKTDSTAVVVEAEEEVNIVTEVKKIDRTTYKLDANYLARMMLREKKNEKMNDSQFKSYLVDSLGFKRDLTRKNDQIYTRKGVTIEITQGTARNYRSIRIKSDNSSEIHRIITGLRKFGLKDVESDGTFGDMKGKDLTAGYGPNSIIIGCKWD